MRDLECGSVVVAHRLSCGMWGLPGPGLEPVSPALAGGFLTTVPPGKALMYIFELWFFSAYMPSSEITVSYGSSIFSF